MIDRERLAQTFSRLVRLDWFHTPQTLQGLEKDSQ